MIRKKLSENVGTNIKRLKTASNISLEREQSTSQYFASSIPAGSAGKSISDKFLQIQKSLNADLKTLKFGSLVHYIYNPVEYAYNPNENYVRKYCVTPKQLVFVGMNPGPFGMCQTGVPFGDVNWVKNWLEITGEVTKPTPECPSRPVFGFDNRRKEQSGHRFWGYFSGLCKTPENFFKHSFVYNYCPLAFLSEDGKNVTPEDIKNTRKKDCTELEAICGKHFLDIVKLLEPHTVIAIGGYIEKKIVNLFKKEEISHIKIIKLPHPSPRARGNWPEKAANFIESHNLASYFKE